MLLRRRVPSFLNFTQARFLPASLLASYNLHCKNRGLSVRKSFILLNMHFQTTYTYDPLPHPALHLSAPTHRHTHPIFPLAKCVPYSCGLIADQDLRPDRVPSLEITRQQSNRVKRNSCQPNYHV